MKTLGNTFIFWCSLVLLALGVTASGQEDEAALATAIRSFVGELGPRYPGSQANLEMEAKVQALFQETGLKTGAIEMAAPALQPGTATMTVGGKLYAIHAMHPTLVRPGNFKEDSFSGRLVYIGQGRDEDLQRVDGVQLENAILVLDYDSNFAWEKFLRFGPAGYLFLGHGYYPWREAESKIYDSEVALPRYFLGEADSRDLLAQFETAENGFLNVDVVAEPTRWKRTVLRSPWVFIPGSDPDLQKRVLVIAAALDSNSIVPELATGAQGAVNLFALKRLLEAFTREPPKQSVLLVAHNAHTLGFLGERELGWNLLAPMGSIQESRGQLAEEIRLQNMYLGHYRKIDFSLSAEKLQELFVGMRTLIDDTTGRRVTVKDPIVALARRDVNQSKAERIHLRRLGLPEAELERRLEQLEEQKQKFVNVLTMFNRVGQKTDYLELSEEGHEGELEILKGYVRTIVERYESWSDLNEKELERSRRNTEIRTALEGRDVSMVIKLELNWAGRTFGFASQDQGNWVRRFGLRSAELGRQLEQDMGYDEGSVFADTLTRIGGLGENYYFQLGDYGLDHLHACQSTPAVVLRNVHAPHGRSFSPDDTFEQLQMSNIARQLPFLIRHLTLIANDPEITSPKNLGKPRVKKAIWSSRVKTFKFDEFSASVLPQLPVEGTMILMIEVEEDDGDTKKSVVGSEVINAYIAMTDERATELVVGMNVQSYICDVYQYDDDFREVKHAVDAGDIVERTGPNIIASDTIKHMALFECEEFVILNRFDTSSIGDDLIAVRNAIVLEARQNGAPRKYGTAGIASLSTKLNRRSLHGPVAVFLEEGDQLKLVTANKQAIINATAEEPEGIGFLSDRGIGTDPMLQAAQDMNILNAYRLEQMAGVTNQLADDFAQRGKEALARVEEAKASRDHSHMLQLMAVASGAQAKAYDQISGMNNDMLKAVVFYVALLLPFCFFIQKLFFKFVRIEAQMGAFAALFFLSFMLFRFIHPAFKVAEAAEAIFVAFVMMALGLFVIWILHKRFEGEMQALFQSYLGVTAEVGYSTVGQKAMLIGVNNMKRRRIRTSLTTATIVLITFAMLAFSSVSKKASPTIIPKDLAPPYTGVFYSWPGTLRMDEATLRTMRSLFADEAEASAVRRWVKGEAEDIGIVTERGTELSMEAVLGVESSEQHLLGDGLPIVDGGRFFSSNNAYEVLLPQRLARALDLDPSAVGNEYVSFMGHRFLIVGLLDDREFRAMKDINNLAIIPIKDVERLGFSDSDREASLRVDPAESNESTIFFVETSAMCVIPEGVAEDLGGQPYSISIKFPDSASMWPVMDRILTATDAKFFISSRQDFEVADSGRSVKSGVYYVGSGYKTSIGGLSRLIIPLLIAGTIILNTMLGSVYERKYEIAVYNAIGLNPTHIGMFFLAEAFVYSVIGSVGGYLIGQVLAMSFIHFDLVAGLNLNFSSLVVVYVILFTIAIVLVSTLYPAYAATRAAVPSGKRKWSLPDHDGRQMEVVFPFIYQQKVAVGILAYLDQYFARFTEASVGELIAEGIEREHRLDEDGRDIYRIVYNIALAPFDLGVTQIVEFKLAYDDVVQSYRLFMMITRQSGQDANWVTTNKPFLEKMRKYLIQWRNMEPSQHMVYVSKADTMFTKEEKANHSPAEA